LDEWRIYPQDAAGKAAAMAKPFFPATEASAGPPGRSGGKDRDISKIPVKTYDRRWRSNTRRLKLLTDVRARRFSAWDDYEYREEAVTKVLRAEGAVEILEELAKRIAALEPFDVTGIEALCKMLAKEKSIKNGAVFHPLRVAVSGRTEGPSLWHMVDFLGKPKTLERIKRAQKMLGKATDLSGR